MAEKTDRVRRGPYAKPSLDAFDRRILGALVADAVRTQSPHALEQLLAQIYAVPGVKGTRSYIALSTYLERPVQAESTETWPTVTLPDQA